MCFYPQLEIFVLENMMSSKKTNSVRRRSSVSVNKSYGPFNKWYGERGRPTAPPSVRIRREIRSVGFFRVAARPLYRPPGGDKSTLSSTHRLPSPHLSQIYDVLPIRSGPTNFLRSVAYPHSGKFTQSTISR